MTRLAIQFAFGLTLFLLAFSSVLAQAQDTASQNSDATPSPAGSDTATQMSENPPLSGLDEPKFEPGFGARSYLAPKLEVTEAVDSNASGQLSSAGNVTEPTRALGSLELHKWGKLHPV